MKTIRFIIILCSLSFTTISASAADETSTELLIGNWDLDVAATLKSMEEEIATLPEAERAGADMMLLMVESMKMSIKYSADTNYFLKGSVMGQDQDRSGTYTLKHLEGKKFTINSSWEKEGVKKNNDGIILFVTDNQFQMSPAKAGSIDPTMVFNRIK